MLRVFGEGELNIEIENDSDSDIQIDEDSESEVELDTNDTENEINMELKYTDAARKYIATVGYDAMYGARPVKRVVQREVVGELSKRILAGEVNRDRPITIDVIDGKLHFSN